MKKDRKYFPVLEWYDKEEHAKVREYYWTTEKGYFYKKTLVDCEDGFPYPAQRISEKQMISAIETYYNA